MQLSKAIGTAALVLAVILAAAYAVGEEVEPAAKQIAQQKADQQPQRRVSLEEQQKRKEHFERSCSKPLKTELDHELCRSAYKAMISTQK